MMIGAAVGAVVTALVAVIGYFYVNVVRQQLRVAGTAMDKPSVVAQAQGFLATLDAHLINWKTVILAWIAGLVQAVQLIPTEALSSWQGLPWAQVVDAKVANWITIGCALLIPILHSRGVAKAALTPPADPGA